MPDKRCPNCRRWSDQAAIKCDCGFDFSTGTLQRPSKAEASSLDKGWRIALGILGVALVPVFVAGLCLAGGSLRPTARTAMSAILVATPLGYWFLYLSGRGRAWVRYLMIFAALAALLVGSLIIYSLIWRIMNPM